MEVFDASVRVLYDFEYNTKYGRNIKITCGERLLLIKKTNNDWWQVIRNTEQRPFFVPASYVEELESKSHGPDRDTSRSNCSKQIQKEIHSENTSLSNSKESITNYPVLPAKSQIEARDKSSLRLSSSSEKQVLDLQTENKISTTTKTVSSTMSSSGYNSLCEEIPVFDDEEASTSTISDIERNSQYKSNSSLCNENKSHSSSKSSFDSKRCDATVDSPFSDKELSTCDDNSLNKSDCEMLENKLHGSKGDGKYSTVVGPRVCVSEVNSHKMISNLPASDSLENLSLQIEVKTSSLRSTVIADKTRDDVSMNRNFDSNTSEELVNKNNHFSPISSGVLSFNQTDKDSKDKLSASFLPNKCKDSRSTENVCNSLQPAIDNNILKYQGSFKTNTERKRWFKKSSSEKRLRNVFSCSEESSSDLRSSDRCMEQLYTNVKSDSCEKTVDDVSTKVCSLANTKEIKTITKTHEAMQKSDCKPKFPPRKHFGSDDQLFQPKTAREKTNSRQSLDSVVENNLKWDEFEESKIKTKDFTSRTMNNLGLKQTNSEKSSTDSLLDLDDGNYRKISGGTTSDSLVPTDGEDLVSSDSETDSVKLTKNKLENLKTAGSNTRKISLTRRKRVFASKSRLDSLQGPPSPTTDQEPSKILGDGWNEYNTEDGRKYFYNLHSKEKRWKPPRRIHNVNVGIEEEHDSNSTADTDDMFVVNLPLPSGWRSELDSANGQTCYINTASGAKWFSSTDNEGRVYFFEENSNKSSWTLPENPNVNNNSSDVTSAADKSSLPLAVEKSLNRNVKSKSMILANRYEDSVSLSSLTQNWPQLWDGTMCILKEGTLNKTKITENGKRIRKNWTSTHAVLTELLLLFFKDNKGFPSMMSGKGGPELSVDLNGAVIDPGDKVSSRKNVYMLTTVLGLQVLIQCDDAITAQQWLHVIQQAINNLPLHSIDSKSPRAKSESPSEEKKINTHIGRSKSMKLKNKSASIEDLSVNVAERQTKIKERLKKFFHRRPTVELLVKKGIWKDEPMFGCLLEQACPAEPPRVPLFVQHCIHCIERSEENMKTDGLYRASGNLSQVQKIRLQVDQNVYSLLEQEEDVHVLAGTLKLFFRELKQPLIPFKFFNKALHASTNPNRNEKIRDFRAIVKLLPPCNYDTLKLLLQHLLSVTQYHEHNRMHIPNIAIVFGPTLMWPEQESLNMAFDLMQQNLVIECFLSDFHLIFQ